MIFLALKVALKVLGWWTVASLIAGALWSVIVRGCESPAAEIPDESLESEG